MSCRYLLVVVAATCFAITASPAAAAGEKSGGPVPAPFAGQDADDSRRKYFTDLPMITHEGKGVRFYSDMLRDKVVLISFFFINCKTDSPRQNVVLSRVKSLLRDRLGKDVFIVSITVDPERDTPAKLKDYAKIFGAGNGWSFLSGKKENVDWVAYKLGQYAPTPEEHSLTYLVGNVKTDQWLKLSKDARPEVVFEKLLSVAGNNHAR